MRDMVAQDEGVDVLGLFRLHQSAAKADDQESDSLGLQVCEAGEAGYVALGIYDEGPQVNRGLAFRDKRVARKDQGALVDGVAGRRRFAALAGECGALAGSLCAIGKSAGYPPACWREETGPSLYLGAAARCPTACCGAFHTGPRACASTRPSLHSIQYWTVHEVEQDDVLFAHRWHAL